MSGVDERDGLDPWPDPRRIPRRLRCGWRRPVAAAPGQGRVDHDTGAESGARPTARAQPVAISLRCQVGSSVHGTAITPQDDRDEMGIVVELPEFVTGGTRLRVPDAAGRFRARTWP